MDNLDMLMEAKKYVESVIGGKTDELNDSVMEQIAEIYVEKALQSNKDELNVITDGLIKNEDLVWASFDDYMEQPARIPGHSCKYEEPIDYMIKNRMYNERFYGSIGTDEMGLDEEEYSEGRRR